MKHTYRIQGTKATRTSERVYTHAIIGIRGGQEFPMGYAGSKDLAEKQLAKFKGENKRFNWSFEKFEIREVEIIK